MEQLSEIFQRVGELGREIFVIFTLHQFDVEFTEVLLESRVIKYL